MDGIVSVLSKTTSLVLTITGSPTFKEIVASIRDYEKETKMLAETIGFIGDLLSDVEGLQFQEKSSEVNAYNRLRIAYLDAQDFLDVIQTAKKKLEAEDMLMKQAEQEIVHKANEKGTRLGSLASAPIKIKTFTKKTSRFFGIRKFTKAHYEIMEIKRNLDAISEDLNKFGLRKVSSKESIAPRSRAKGAFVNERSIIGRDEDKRKVIDLLLGACIIEEQVPVISIVGIGGMGKTTVAQLVYDDKSQLESCKFDLKLWVSDSQQFDLKVLLQKILKSISSDDTSLQSLEIDSLQNRLREKIDGKKYLLVLDDVENESREDWTELEELLKLGANGSRILVTTRSRRVAKVMSSDSMIYELDCLSKEDSWLLFERMAFKGSKDEKLVQIGKDVFQKCGGVPLAIKTIGCLLYGQADNKWERVRTRDLAKIEGDSNRIIPILKVSYDALDPKSKECFRYCALFPKSEPISKRLLINIWMSNVSIETNRGEQTEDVLEEIIMTLYERCFLEKMEKQYRYDDDNDEYFKMHDLMHDLAKEVAGAEMFVVDSDVTLDSGTLSLEENIRHVILTSKQQTVDRISRFEPKGRRLRTLMHHETLTSYMGNPWEKLLSVDKLKSEFPVLRMLDLRYSNIDRLPDSVGEMIHLRYLDLSGNKFNTLPDSIGKLWNLHSLLLKQCYELEKLPVGVRKLINLRDLDMESCYSLTNPMSSGMGALKFLRTLTKFIVGDSESKHTAKLEDLEHLSNLQGDLTVKLPKKSTLKEESGSSVAILLNKKGLRTLNIEWPEDRYIQVGEDFVLASDDLGNGDMDIFVKLQPHSNLENLTLSGYEGLRFPPWTDDLTSLLPNLVSLEIGCSTRCQHLPSFSKLLCLKTFTVVSLLSLEYMEEYVPAAGAPFFPSLERFGLCKLPKLKGWCRELAGVEQQFYMLPSFPHRLAQLYINECPNLRMTSMPFSSTSRRFCMKLDGESSCIMNVGEDLSSYREKFLIEDNADVDDLAVSSPLVSIPGEFWADNVQLFMSTPWEQLLHCGPPSLSIVGFNVFDISPKSMVEASFRQMSKCITSLFICSIPGLKTFPKVLRHLTVLRDLYFFRCHELTGEEYIEDEQSLEHKICQPWNGFESLRLLSFNRLSELVRLPREILSVTSLQVLDIQLCRELKVLRTQVSDLINLKYLKISEINDLGVKSFNSGSDISNLECIQIDFYELETPVLQSLCQYQWLKHLKLSEMPNLEYIQDNNSVAFSFPSLEKIWLHRLPVLRDWCKGLASSSEKEKSLRKMFPRLSRLDILACPNFNENSVLLSSVRAFTLGYYTSPFPKSSSLSKSLYCELSTTEESLYKTVLLEQYYRGNSLAVMIYREDFEIAWTEQDLERVSSRITSLHLEHSNILKTLPPQLNFLTALQSLSIVGYRHYNNLGEYVQEKQSDGMPWGGLKNLTHLEYRDLPEMKTLPEWFQFTPSLQELQISACENLVLPDWVHVYFDYVSLPGQQGFRLVRKRIGDSSSSTTQLHN